MNLPPLTLVIPLVLGAGACNGDDDHHHADAGYDCSTETRADTYVAGLEKIGGGPGFKFKLMDSMPAPPKKGDNDWTIKVTDESDVPITGATVTVTPFMPDHGHGTPITADVTEMGDGNYLATPVNLWMPGLWEVTVRATNGGEVDEAKFSFCIDI